jgi:hypothetical protein
MELMKIMNSNDRVYLLFNVNGINIDPALEQLDGPGATFICSDHFEFFYEGQLIGPAVLVLPDKGMPVVYPIVQWKHWPMIGVEFMEISEDDRRMIAESTHTATKK